MVKIFGLDIPSGLEDLWNSFFQFTDKTLQNNFILKTAVPTRQKLERWDFASLFVRLQIIYDGIGAPDRAEWDDFWGTLPFGSHSGGNGWPGSGYSAFIYINAPRIRANLPLLLLPPISANYDFESAFGDQIEEWTGYYAAPKLFERIFTASSGDLTDHDVGFFCVEFEIYVSKFVLKDLTAGANINIFNNPNFSGGMSGWTASGSPAYVGNGRVRLRTNDYIFQSPTLILGHQYRLNFVYSPF